MKVFEWCYTLDNTLHEARRPTEAEKARYSADWAEHMIFGVGDHIKLPYVSSNDIPHEWWKTRTIWHFNGFGNQCVEVSDDEWNQLLALNAQREAEKKEQERQEQIRRCQTVIRVAEQQQDIPSPEEAARRRKVWNDIYNEGGEGYIPTIIDSARYASAKKLLQELMEGAEQ